MSTTSVIPVGGVKVVDTRFKLPEYSSKVFADVVATLSARTSSYGQMSSAVPLWTFMGLMVCDPLIRNTAPIIEKSATWVLVLFLPIQVQLAGSPDAIL
jgi:hypothetical protein